MQAACRDGREGAHPNFSATGAAASSDIPSAEMRKSR